MVKRLKLNEKTLREAEPKPGVSYQIFDTEVIGFAARVQASGARTFTIDYRHAGRQRRMTIGRWPEWSVTAARERAKELRRAIDEFDSTLGNYIFIRVKETGTYLVLGHLQYQSVEVEVGDQVTEGDIIARAGNTGTSSEPHLHIHHQLQNPNDVLMTAQGLPLYFRDGTDIFMPEGGGDIATDGTRQPVGDTLLPPVKDGSETSAKIPE